MGRKFCYSCHIVFFNQVFARFNIWNLINISDCLIFCFNRLNTHTTTLSSILNPLPYWGLPVISKSIYFPKPQQMTGGQINWHHLSVTLPLRTKDVRGLLNLTYQVWQRWKPTAEVSSLYQLKKKFKHLLTSPIKE